MPQNERIASTPVRVSFSKTGALSFISHLDLMRTVTRMLVRADIGIYYTEGFNPHPKLVFALPLSVGVESVAELFDVKILEGNADCGRILERLRAEAPGDIEIKEVYVPSTKFSAIAYSEYEIAIYSDSVTDDAVSAVAEMMSGPITVLKRTKSGEAECDIRPLIASLDCRVRGGALCLKTRLSASPESYLNPEYVIRAVTDAAGITLDNIAPGGDSYTIMRTGIFDADGNAFR